MNTEAINGNRYYDSSVIKLSDSIFSDLFHEDFENINIFRTFQSSSFPSKKFKDKNFKYMLSETMKKAGGKPRQTNINKQLTA